MSCQLCTNGFTFDLVWVGHWTVQEIGRCKCEGGTSEPRAEIVALAHSSGRHVNKILVETLIKNVECQLTQGRQLNESEVNRVLAAYAPEPAPKEPDYDFGDGFVRENDEIPF